MATVSVLYFGPFSSFHFSPLPLYLPPSFFNSFHIHLYILYLYRSMFYDITDALSCIGQQSQLEGVQKELLQQRGQSQDSCQWLNSCKCKVPHKAFG
jgi:hypothetical protein